MPGVEQLDIQTGHRIGLFICSLFLFMIVLECVRRGWLKERYALLWLATALLGLVIGLFPSLIIAASNLFRFQYLTVIVSSVFIFTLGLVLIFSIVISRLSERTRRLTQELALLEQHVRTLEKRLHE